MTNKAILVATSCFTAAISAINFIEPITQDTTTTASIRSIDSGSHKTEPEKTWLVTVDTLASYKRTVTLSFPKAFEF